MGLLLAKAFAIIAQGVCCYLLTRATNKRYSELIKIATYFLLAEVGVQLAIDMKDWFEDKIEWVDDKTEAIKKPIETIEKPIEKAVDIKESVDKSVNDNIHKPAGEIRKGASEHYENAKDYLNKLNPFGKE